MIRTNLNFQAILSRLCAAGLAMLGFSCSSDEPGGGGEICMYGAPTGTFEIKGKVATDNGKDVADAIIRVTRPQFDSGSYSYSESNTNAAGEYSATGHDDGYDKIKVVCLPQDATLEADSTIVDLKHIKDNKHDNIWYRGHAEATVNFKLKNKEGGK